MVAGLRAFGLFLLAAFLISAPAFAAGEAPNATQTDTQQDPFALDLNSLLGMKVITASKFSEDLSGAPGMISVVTRDELKRFGGITLREILERVAGLSGSTASFTDRSIVAVRGDQTKINGGHILYLINGRPTREILEGGLSGDLLESFPISILERIEVIRGPGSVLYGSNAFSGVVNLITQKAEGNGVVISALGSGGPGVATSGQVTFQRGQFSLIGAGQFHQKPNWSTPCYSPFGGLQHVTIPDRGKGGYLGIDYKGLRIMSSYTEYKTSYIEGTVGEARWRRGFADIGYGLKAGAKWDMNFNLTYTRATMDAIEYIPFIDRDSQDLVFEWTNVLTLSSKDQLTFGSLYNFISGIEYSYGVDSKIAIADGSRSGGAAYAQIEHELAKDLKIIGGFQANKIEGIELSVVPRAGLIWNPAPHFSVKALYSEAFRAPSLNETLIHYVPSSTTPGPSLLGTPNLKPEKVATIDVGFGYQGNRFQAGIDYFHSKQTDDIILDVRTWAWKYVNLGETTFQGVELDGKYYFDKRFFLMGSLLYQANEDIAGKKNVTPIANFGYKAGLSYESAKGFTASLFDVYEGHMNGYEASLNPKPGAYHLLNAHLRFDLTKYFCRNAKTGFALVAHADNLTDKAVWLPDWKDNPGGTIFSSQGRTVYFGIEVALGNK